MSVQESNPEPAIWPSQLTSSCPCCLCDAKVGQHSQARRQSPLLPPTLGGEEERQMTKYDFIIIGGGPNGLCVAACLSKAGQKVLVLEKHIEVGGGLATI